MIAPAVFEPLKGTFTVIAFYGPAGTGKSMRAQALAAEKSVDLIIDDGLVVSRGRIMAGRSAKAEENMVRAIRRAMFHFPEHRREVRFFLEKQAPCKVMVLATSQQMAYDICTVLGLPDPSQEIEISEVASSEDIAKALHERKQNKRHVIPVAQTQVSKNFTGRLVGRLKSLWAGKDDNEKTIVRPPFSYYGTLRIDPLALRQIVDHVARTTAQIVGAADVKVKDDEGLIISLSLTVATGALSIREIVSELKLRIRVAVEQLTGMKVFRIDTTVEEVKINGGEL